MCLYVCGCVCVCEWGCVCVLLLFPSHQGGRGHWTINYPGAQSLITLTPLLKNSILVGFKQEILIHSNLQRGNFVYCNWG